MGTFYVTYKVEARYIAKVRAGSLDEAKALAEDMFCEADFGDAEDIDGEPIIIEDEDGSFVWER